mmetsp:Transcript_18836/g.40069  ORF Transcript_18836/g.40069 Transcript_18836/m.40069 type:complete len:221 (-) Transcript_18836:176-838(-)
MCRLSQCPYNLCGNICRTQLFHVCVNCRSLRLVTLETYLAELCSLADKARCNDGATHVLCIGLVAQCFHESMSCMLRSTINRTAFIGFQTSNAACHDHVPATSGKNPRQNLVGQAEGAEAICIQHGLHVLKVCASHRLLAKSQASVIDKEVDGVHGPCFLQLFVGVVCSDVAINNLDLNTKASLVDLGLYLFQLVSTPCQQIDVATASSEGTCCGFADAR